VEAVVATQDQELCNQHNQVAQVAEQLAIQDHLNLINQANQEHQVKETQAETQAAQVAVAVAAQAAAAHLVMAALVVMGYHIQLADLLRHMQAVVADLTQAAQVDQAVAAMATIQVVHKTMQHFTDQVAEVAGTMATLVPEQAIKE
jgi:precorrin-3B methylase